MKELLSGLTQLDNASTNAFLLGDVAPIIKSRAHQTYRPSSYSSGSVPLSKQVEYGLGALTAQRPDEVGEAIVLRKWGGITPPVAKSGTHISYYQHNCLTQVETPFFVGWKGTPLWCGAFRAPVPITIKDVHAHVFQKMRNQMGQQASPLIFVEIAALFDVANIFDRALKASVAAPLPGKEDFSITDEALVDHYFRLPIIASDFEQYQYERAQLPLVIAGVGLEHRPGSPFAPLMHRVENLAFYQPPQKNGAASPDEATQLKTHNHAMGWREQPALTRLLQTPAEDAQGAFQAYDTEILPEALRTQPDYIVHIDDWSRLAGGFIRVFVPDLAENGVELFP